MVRSDGQCGVVTQQADDVQVGEPRLHHHDVRALRLVQARLPQRLTIVTRVLLVRLLVGGNDATALTCSVAGGRLPSVYCDRVLTQSGEWGLERTHFVDTGVLLTAQQTVVVATSERNAWLNCNHAHLALYL